MRIPRQHKRNKGPHFTSLRFQAVLSRVTCKLDARCQWRAQRQQQDGGKRKSNGNKKATPFFRGSDGKDPGSWSFPSPLYHKIPM